MARKTTQAKGQVPPGTGVVSTARMATIQRLSTDRGISKEVAFYTARSQRQSSRTIYDSRWNIFEDWCRSRQIDPSKASVDQCTEFLLHLHTVKKLATSTIRGYASSLSSVFKFDPSRVNPMTDVVVTNLIRGMDQDKAESARPRSQPKWELPVILEYLTKEEDDSVKSLTIKAAFLVALSSGCRTSELHALSSHVQWHEDRAVLTTVDGFMTKTQRPSDGIRGMAITVNKLERSQLCPVTALKRYLATTDGLLKDRLWVSYNAPRQRGVSKYTLANWLCLVIKYAYIHGEKELPEHINAHEIRAISASMFVHNCQKDDDLVSGILKSGLWKSERSFLNHYLRDVHQWRDRLMDFDFECIGETIHTS